MHTPSTTHRKEIATMTKRTGPQKTLIVVTLLGMSLGLTPAAPLQAFAGEKDEVQAPRGQDVQAPRGQDRQVPRGQGCAQLVHA
jgi:hypothetical protein